MHSGLFLGASANSMDHEARLKQNLRVFGVENLSSLSLGELAEGIDKKLPADENVSRKRLLHIYIAWLNERLALIDNSDEETVRKEIREWVDFLRQCQNTDLFLAHCFAIWAADHTKLEPTSLRRLNFTWLELQAILDLDGGENYVRQESYDRLSTPQNSLESPQASNIRPPDSVHSPHSDRMDPQGDVNIIDDHYGTMHPDRHRQPLSDDEAEIEDAHWGSMHPDRYRQSLKGDEAEIDDSRWGSMHPSRYKQSLKDRDEELEDGQPVEVPPSFLTGANHLVYIETMKHARRRTPEPRESYAVSPDLKPSASRKVEREWLSSRAGTGKPGWLDTTRPMLNEGNKGSGFRSSKRSGRSKKGRKDSRQFCRRCDGHGMTIP